MKTSEILEKARKLIEKPENWSPKGWTTSRGGMCMEHALQVANSQKYFYAIDQLESTLGGQSVGECPLMEFPSSTRPHALASNPTPSKNEHAKF